MSTAAATSLPSPATEADLLAQPQDGPCYELVDGELVKKETSAWHSHGQSQLTGLLFPYHRRRGPEGPGGWWILTEAFVRFGSQVRRPDLAGWRRETLQQLPREEVIAQRPDWICEIISLGHEARDHLRKRRLYHQEQVPHYWIIDPRDQSLMVLRWSAPGYIEILLAEREDIVRAEPFTEVELAVADLFANEADQV